ncbi:sulfite exporter TauE/SafE family protein [Streptomyces sp. AJS327]|uniref:sulfite exporter TauE/SafE family protein n=1 Tax=Streptomyces sp. AJS327 TaxID=2545265 RepID=UPI0015DF8E61|nr:sulfite exporter TauE/SafE family protein [Streptomyces sp. AJS327]MBA0050141.1 sulfite exporter TauE/SafE family protein [Streptomyces sp. AJS327]
MTTLLLALAAGAVVGLVLGALGGGGGILAVPALTYLLGLEPVTAATVSLVIVAGVSAVALLTHARDGQVRWKAGALFAAAGVAPAALGGWFAIRLPSAALTVAFAVLAACAALPMLRRRPVTGRGSTGGAARAAGAGAGLGAVTGVLGVGGGFLAVPALHRLVRLPMRAAVGTSLLVITVNSLAGLALRGNTVDTLDAAVLLPFAGAALLGVWDGKRLASKVPEALLRRTFGLVLLVVSAGMLVELLLGVTGVTR